MCRFQLKLQLQWHDATRRTLAQATLCMHALAWTERTESCKHARSKRETLAQILFRKNSVKSRQMMPQSGGTRDARSMQNIYLRMFVHNASRSNAAPNEGNNKMHRRAYPAAALVALFERYSYSYKTAMCATNVNSTKSCYTQNGYVKLEAIWQPALSCIW